MQSTFFGCQQDMATRRTIIFRSINIIYCAEYQYCGNTHSIRFYENFNTYYMRRSIQDLLYNHTLKEKVSIGPFLPEFKFPLYQFKVYYTNKIVQIGLDWKFSDVRFYHISMEIQGWLYNQNLDEKLSVWFFFISDNYLSSFSIRKFYRTSESQYTSMLLFKSFIAIW